MHNTHHLSALRPGARLNSYAIGAVLGAGGFGITYKAVEDITGRTVAIKEYLPASFAVRDRDGTTVRPLSVGATEDFAWGLDRFREEAKLLIDFRHPNIVPVLAYFEANATGYLVMEFQDGVSLGDMLEQRGVLSEAETRAIVVPLLDGVEDVHRHGFLHRDIKPDNIFVRGNGTPVLLDFGAARQALGEHSKNLTTLLTEGYAPFEQYAGAGNQGPWSDVYALAAVMFRCVVGKAPLPSPHRASARLRGNADPLAADLAELGNRFSPEFAAAIATGLAVVEHERPKSIAGFRDLIQGTTSSAAMAPAGPDAPNPTLVPDAALRAGLGVHPPRRESRRRHAVAIAAVFTALIAAGATIYAGDHRSWLPEAFRRAGSDPAPAAAAAPPPDPAKAVPGSPRGSPAEAPLSPDSLKALAEHQQRQLDQAEAERRAAESSRTADAERKRREEEAAKEAERKRADEDRARQDDRARQEDRAREVDVDRARTIDGERARAEEQRRARAEDERRKQEDERARARERAPARVAPGAPPAAEADRARQPPGNWPPDMPGQRRVEPRQGAPDGPVDDRAARERRQLPNPDEY